MRHAWDCALILAEVLLYAKSCAGVARYPGLSSETRAQEMKGAIHPCGIAPSLTRAGLTCPVPRFRVWPDPSEPLLWQQDGVDHVDHAVAAKDVGFHDVGVVNHHGVAVGMNG